MPQISNDSLNIHIPEGSKHIHISVPCPKGKIVLGIGLNLAEQRMGIVILDKSSSAMLGLWHNSVNILSEIYRVLSGESGGLKLIYGRSEYVEFREIAFLMVKGKTQ